ncbi:glycoside hydrolase family 88 protein [Scleroderma citrinum Foug A]|uniref:Glycoside hydrolase family 88 protein n=1 Tax=Scleroderma citrinum Foug A TaxID=1036808 RepID=A0A0C2YWQ8_9AGAM|nr:glycoside hydrolase family 88 protein [Scleroderma citrinum Foug A]
MLLLVALLLFLVTLEQYIFGAEITPKVPTASLVWPPELYRRLSLRNCSTPSIQHAPARYPQYTGHTVGKWKRCSADLWTTGIFPAMLYEIKIQYTATAWSRIWRARRRSSVTDWVRLGRSWSATKVALEVNSHVGHDL